MGRWASIPVAGGAYSDESRPWAHQECVNLMVENAERPGSRSVAKLRAVPGMAILSDLGTNAPIRGMRNVEGLLVVVSGNHLFTIDVNGAVTNVGTIPGVLRTKMTHNQIAGGNEVAIPADGLGYVYNTHTGELKQITDDGFLGVSTFDYIDSFVVGVEPRGRFAFTSDLADATSYNTLDRVEAESSPDLIVGHIVNHEEWWLCGQTTIEPFVNDGSATGTFKRQGGTVIQRGVASAHCMSLLDNAVFAVGDDGCVYRFDGYTPVRISTMPIEQALSECNLALCFSFTFEDQGHKIYYITCPDGYTWGYDVASKEWHRRASKGLKRWRLNDLVKWNGRWIGGDFSNGKLYQLDWGLASDVGDELVRERSMGVIHDNQNAVIINGLELVVDTGKSSAPEFATYVLNVKGDLPDGSVGDVVDFRYTVRSSLLPCTLAVSAGSLPGGLTMDDQGHITGTITAAGSFNWTIEATDAKGHHAQLDDTCVVALLPATLTWKSKQVAWADTTDYSGVSVDDSAWSLAPAPFGDSRNPTYDPHSFDPRFTNAIATEWPAQNVLWVRAKITLSSVPANGIKLTFWMDDHFTMYVNGTSVYSFPGVDGGHGGTQTVSSDKLVVGDNVIAFACYDEDSSGASQYVFFECIAEAL